MNMIQMLRSGVTTEELFAVYPNANIEGTDEYWDLRLELTLRERYPILDDDVYEEGKAPPPLIVHGSFRAPRPPHTGSEVRAEPNLGP